MQFLTVVNCRILRSTFYFALLFLLLPTHMLVAQESNNSGEANYSGTSLNTDLALPIFGIYYLDIELPIHEHIDLTFGLVYQELHKWLMPDWSENRAGYIKLGASYFFSNTKKGSLIYTDTFIGWIVLDTYKSEPSEKYDGLEYIHQIMGGYRFYLCDKVFITPLLGMLYGYSWALADANKKIDEDINYFEVGPALGLTVGFKF